MKLLLVRHGETTWNVEGRYQGRQESSLSERGRKQASAVARALVRSGARAVLTSPLSRALDTALVIADGLGLATQVDERLIEISHGRWEGLTLAEIEQRWPELRRLWVRAPEQVVFPDGESLSDVDRRLRSFLGDQTAANATVVAVTHDVVVRLAVLVARGWGLSRYNDVRIDNASITELAVTAGRVIVSRVGDASHLGALRADARLQVP